MQVPDVLTVHISTDRSADLSGIIVVLTVSSGRKNPFRILIPKTDARGEAQLSRADFLGQFDDHRNTFPMDYDGAIESASSTVEVSLFDPTWSLEHRSEALAWPLAEHERGKWSSREQEYEARTSCRNLLFSALPVTVDLRHTSVVDLPVEARDLAPDSA